MVMLWTFQPESVITLCSFCGSESLLQQIGSQTGGQGLQTKRRNAFTTKAHYFTPTSMVHIFKTKQSVSEVSPSVQKLCVFLEFVYVQRDSLTITIWLNLRTLNGKDYTYLKWTITNCALSFAASVCVFVRKQRLENRLTDFCENWYLEVLIEFLDTVQFRLRSD